MSGGVPAGERLKPCPFCGGEAVLRGQDAPEYWVACPAIGCEANTESFSSRNAAIAVWNARTTPAGWVLVPVEPTEAMIAAAPWIASEPESYDTRKEYLRENASDILEVWSAMLSATPTPPIEGRDADVERVARALCEYQIRQARRWDTEPDRLEEMMPAAVHYGWHYFTEQARAALQALGERG